MTMKILTKPRHLPRSVITNPEATPLAGSRNQNYIEFYGISYRLLGILETI